MFINPQDPRVGNGRQAATRQMIAQLAQSGQHRRRSMSRFAAQGQGRAARASRPFRRATPGGGVRFGNGRPGMLASLLQLRGPGVPFDAKHYGDILPGGPPRIADPSLPSELPPPIPIEGPIPGPGPGAPQGPMPGQGPGAIQGQIPDQGPGVMQGQIPGQPGAMQGQLPDFGGLIPLGGGVWFNPITGQIHGGGLGAGGGIPL